MALIPAWLFPAVAMVPFPVLNATQEMKAESIPI
jgi:hypothetical protein